MQEHYGGFSLLSAQDIQFEELSWHSLHFESQWRLFTSHYSEIVFNVYPGIQSHRGGFSLFILQVVQLFEVISQVPHYKSHTMFSN